MSDPMELASHEAGAGPSGKAKSAGLSRRRILKRAIVASAGVAVGASPVLATSNQPDQPPQPPQPPNAHQLVTPTVVTPGTSYKMLSGSDFRPLDSSTGYGSTAFNAVYALNAATYFIATLDLPQQAQITELEFYLRHNAAGAATVYLSQATPSNGGEFYYVTNNLATASANIVTLPVAITVSNNVPKVNNAAFKFLLFWVPSATGSTDVLFGARVGYTGGLGRFGA